jgi:hypothetical protein
LDIINSCSFFHLFSYEQNIEVGKKVVQLLKPQAGSLLIGRQVGNINAGERSREGGKKVFRHDAETWKKMWDEIGDLTGTKWNTHAELLGTEGHVPGHTKEELKGWSEEGMRKLRFVVRRV